MPNKRKHDQTSPLSLTAAEAEVMEVIWENSPIMISEISELIPRELAYSTVLTVVRILNEKGFVEQRGKEGRAFIYEPKVQRAAVQQSMAKDLASRVFGGSVKSMVLNLIQEDSIEKQDLDEVKALIRKLESQQ